MIILEYGCMNNIFKFSLLIGLILRVLLAITSYHSDLGAFALAGHYIVNQGKILNFYDMTKTETATVFNYQPLAYLYPSVFYLPFEKLLNSTYSLIQNTNINSLKSLIVYWPLLVYKLPMLAADLFILWLLPSLFKEKKQKQIAQVLWLLNPLAIYVGSMMGQVDVVIAALLLTAYYYYQRKRYVLCAVMIALSALFKPIGLVLLPLLLIDTKNIKATIGGVLVYLLGIAPYLSSQAYRYYAFAAEQINKTTFAGIAIASGTVIPWFFVMMIVIAAFLWYRKISFLEGMIAILLSSLAFSHFHPQWLVWITPLFLLWLIQKGQIILWPLLVTCWILILLSFDPSLHSQIFLASRWNLVLPLQSENLVLLARAGLIALIWLVIEPSVINGKS